MTRRELIEQLKRSGINKIYGKVLSRASKAELEQAWLNFTQFNPSHLSVTQARMYLRCGLAYWFRYVEGRLIPPKGSTIVGKSIHRALEMDLKQALAGRGHLPLSVLSDIYLETFKQEASLAIWDRETPERGRISGLRVLEEFARKALKEIDPQAVELEFEVPLNAKVTLKGVVDVIDKNMGILDHKITTRKLRPEEVLNDFQLSLYSQALNLDKVGLNVLIRQSHPQIDLFRYTTSEKQRRRALNILLYVLDGIQKRAFLPAPPGSWWCSSQWCGYWEVCHEELS